MPEFDRENEFELLYKEQGKESPAVNVRRPFSLDLVYPIPELRPFIGKKNNINKDKLLKPRIVRASGAPESGQVTESG